MRKGSIPIPYIIALLLGIAVVAILGYWFFVLGGQWGQEVTLETCTSKATIYCTTWQGNGYATTDDGKPQVGGLIGKKWFSATDTDPTVGTYAPRCVDYTILDDAGLDADDLADSCAIMLGTP